MLEGGTYFIFIFWLVLLLYWREGPILSFFFGWYFYYAGGRDLFFLYFLVGTFTMLKGGTYTCDTVYDPTVIVNHLEVTLNVTFEVTFDVTFEVTFDVTFDVTFEVTFDVTSDKTITGA
jgi:hypothetical protein